MMNLSEAGKLDGAIHPLVLISSLAEGGAERVTVSFLRHLAAQGVAVTLCTVTNRYDSFLAEDVRRSGIRRIDLGAPRLASLRLLVQYMRVLRRERFDIVHAHGQDASIVALAGRWLTGIPLVITRHVQEEPAANWRQKLRLKAALISIRRADGIVAVSESTLLELKELTPLNTDFVRVIHNGIEVSRFDDQAVHACRQDMRVSLQISEKDRMILVLSVLRSGKGHDVLLNAWPAIRNRNRAAKLVIAGGGEMEQELRAQARPHGDSVCFLGPRNDVPQLFAAADLVVLPSISEALPTVIMEAAAAGKAVVASNVGGVPELVDDSRTGLLVPAQDQHALADAIVRMISNPRLAETFGEAAKTKAAREFSMERQVRQTLELWNEILERKKRR